MKKLNLKFDRPKLINKQIWMTDENESNIYIMDVNSDTITYFISNESKIYRNLYGCVDCNNHVVFLPGQSDKILIIDKKEKKISSTKYEQKKENWSDTYATYVDERYVICLPLKVDYIEYIDLKNFSVKRNKIDMPIKHENALFSKRYITIEEKLFLGYKNAPYLMELDLKTYDIKWKKIDVEQGICDIAICGEFLWILTSDNRIIKLTKDFKILKIYKDDLNLKYEFVIPTLVGKIYCFARTENIIGVIYSNTDSVTKYKSEKCEFISDGKHVNFGDVTEDEENIFVYGRLSCEYYIINKYSGLIREMNLKCSQEVEECIRSKIKRECVIEESAIYSLKDYVKDL